MEGSFASSAEPQRSKIDLVVLCYGAGLELEAERLRDVVLPGVASWFSELHIELQLHPWWPEDIDQPDDERPGVLAQTPLELVDLVMDDDVFVLIVLGTTFIGPHHQLMVALNTRAAGDPRVRHLFTRRWLISEATKRLKSLFQPLLRDEGMQYGVEPTELQDALKRWLAEGMSSDQFTAGSYRVIAGQVRGVQIGDGNTQGQIFNRLTAPDAPAAVVDENVQFTVYRPNAVLPEVWYPLLAFAHLAERRADAPPTQPDPLEQVRALAAQVLGDDSAYGAPRGDARGGVPRESQLTFVPVVEGVDFNPRSQTFEWLEDVHQQNFRMRARDAAAGTVLRGQLTVYLGAFILADVDLAFKVEISAAPPPTPTVLPVTLLASSSASPQSRETELTPVTAVPYQKVFPSYSHKDLSIVRQAEAYGKALGHVYLRDRLALRSGEEWETRLLELIDEADIFQLFWSSNSMRSEYVRREWEHALALGRRAFIRPTYWELPMPQSTNPRLPPDELAKLHFHGFFEEPDDDFQGWLWKRPIGPADLEDPYDGPSVWREYDWEPSFEDFDDGSSARSGDDWEPSFEDPDDGPSAWREYHPSAPIGVEDPEQPRLRKPEPAGVANASGREPEREELFPASVADRSLRLRHPWLIRAALIMVVVLVALVVVVVLLRT